MYCAECGSMLLSDDGKRGVCESCNEEVDALPKPKISLERAIKDVAIAGKTFYYWYEPGNGTRYDVVLTMVPGKKRLAIVLENHGRGCSIPTTALDADYLSEKLRIGTADAEALLPLLAHYLAEEK